VFKMMGKDTDAAKCYDCRACGYNSCREMATAICRGLNSPNNCIIRSKDLLVELQKGINEQEEKYTEITNKCRDLFEDLQEKFGNVKTNAVTLEESSAKTSEKTKVLNDLVTNIIIFCKNNDSLNKEGINQMIVILETTLKSLQSLDESVGTTNENFDKISATVDEIKTVIENIDKTLNETANVGVSK
ncbi:MAG: (4Fe-4S)-binding protein, partial [Ruminococcus sp.]|nr:(4Fe-4S)-binding protein [Ruminococcus sp.]